MQSSSINFTEAATGAGRVRADRLLVDWSTDGAGPVTIADDFTRTLSQDWGSATRDIDGVTTLVPYLQFGSASTAFDVTGNVATHEVAAAGDYALSYLDGLTFADVDATVNFSCPAPSGAGLEPCNWTVRGTATDTYLMMRHFIGVSGAVLLSLIELDGGIDTELDVVTVPDLTYTGNSYLTSRLQVYGTEVKARVWAAGTREPVETWHLEVTYDGPLTVAGWSGIRSGVSVGNLNAKPVTFSYDTLRMINGALDDMSAQLGAWTVDHHLDDGLPDEVSFVAGTAVPTLRAEVNRPGWVPGRGRFTNRSFFSPYNTDSPIYGIERDVPPTTLEAGVVTEDGREYLPVFTGRAQDFTINGTRVSLSAISATRLKLAKLVQPPAVYGFFEGANATWPVSYALTACGVYASPPPQVGCRLWVPFHGSVHSFIPARNSSQINLALWATDMNGSVTSGAQHIIDHPWLDGPFVSAVDLSFTAEREGLVDIVSTGTGVEMEDGEGFLTQAGAQGKVEFWIRGDAALTAGATSLGRFLVNNANGTSVDCLVAVSNRGLTLNINDGTTNSTFTYSGTLPTDDEWHFVGYAWRIDGASSKRWINLDGAVETNTTSFSTAGLPTTESFVNDTPRLIFRLPVAEFQLTTGALADPDDSPWLLDIPFTPGAQVVPSSVNLVSIAERAPREAWELISAYALAELAMLRIDETDVVRYLGWRHWGQSAQQTVVDVLDTRRNMGLPNVNIDPTKIVNAVAATFSEGFNIDRFTSGGSLFDVLTLLPGITVLALPTDADIVELRGFGFTYIATATTDEPSTNNFVSINLATDGTGAYATATEVVVTVLSWHSGEVIIEFNNISGVTWYTANDKSFATVNVAGKLLDLKSRTVTEADDNSIAVRGERGLPVALTALQRSIDARRTARRIVNDLSGGVPTLGRVDVRGHPGRQPGDLVTVVDPEAGVNNRFRIQSVFHDDDGELYTQQITARRARQGGTWGVDAYWGETIWTTED